MTPKFRIGDSVRITGGESERAVGIIIEETISAGRILYFVEGDEVADWVEEELLGSVG